MGMFDLSGVRYAGRYEVEVEVKAEPEEDSRWKTLASVDGVRIGRRWDEVVAVAERLVDPSVFDSSAESIPQKVRILRVDGLRRLVVAPAIAVQPLQLEVARRGNPDQLQTESAGSIATDQLQWILVEHRPFGYRPADLVAVAQRYPRIKSVEAMRIFREVDGVRYELWSATAPRED